MKNNISEHVTYDEATFSNTAVARAIDNVPDDATIEKMQCVALNIFEPVRAFICLPIRVNSFYRSIALNKAVGGASNSQHVTGEAMDLDCKGHNKQIFHYILNYLIFDQVIWEFGNTDEPDWVHVSRKNVGNRKEALMSVKIAGLTKYFAYR